MLYNLSDEIVGYCYDMINLSESSTVSQNDNEPATAYVIVNADTKGFPILLFGADGTSAYLGGGYDKTYYFGTLDFYLEVDEDVVNARANEELSSSDIDMFASSQGQISSKKEDYSSVREAYLGGDDSVVVSKSISSNSDSLALAPLSVLPESGSVSIGQNLQWRKGFAPTAVAMLICTRYSIFDGNKVIDALAGHMQTDSAGATAIQRVTSGTNLFFINDTNLAAPKTYGWNSPDSASLREKAYHTIQRIRLNPQ